VFLSECLARRLPIFYVIFVRREIRPSDGFRVRTSVDAIDIWRGLARQAGQVTRPDKNDRARIRTVWTAAQTVTLANVQFAVADLGDPLLGLANPATNTIRIDDAARFGRSVTDHRSPAWTC